MIVKVLVACETSGIVRDAFREKGHDAWSLDVLPSENPSYHIQCDLREMDFTGWDMVIAHPPCTYLAVSGYHRVYKNPERLVKVKEALDFANFCFNIPVDKLVIENPVSILSTRVRKPDQIIQPYDFNEDASKKTCLWIKGLPLLKGSGRFPGRVVNYGGKLVERWSNQTDSGQNRLGPSEDRWKLRSKTYQGIAKAMAEQWG